MSGPVLTSGLLIILDHSAKLFLRYNQVKLCRFKSTFLNKDTNKWECDANYQSFKFKKLAHGFTPVNDAAERMVKLSSNFIIDPELHENTPED